MFAVSTRSFQGRFAIDLSANLPPSYRDSENSTHTNKEYWGPSGACGGSQEAEACGQFVKVLVHLIVHERHAEGSMIAMDS